MCVPAKMAVVIARFIPYFVYFDLLSALILWDLGSLNNRNRTNGQIGKGCPYVYFTESDLSVWVGQPTSQCQNIVRIAANDEHDIQWEKHSQWKQILMKMTAFWNMTPCNLVEVDRRFRERTAYVIRAITLIKELVNTSETSWEHEILQNISLFNFSSLPQPSFCPR